MTATVLRGDARHLPLPDASVDLIVTSPPYFGLRSYTDGGAHYPGQIGSEATPAEWLAALVECTAEWVRVLKPEGSLFVNLGDSHSSQPAGRAGDNSQVNGKNPAQAHAARRGERSKRPTGGRQFCREDAAWLAGVIDSDGSISIRINKQPEGRSPSFVPWVRVGQTRPEVVQKIGAITGTGQVFQDARGVWNWNAAAQQARWILARIYPWLTIKRRQAAAAIELARHVEERNARSTYRPLTREDVAYRQRLKDAVIAWNGGQSDDLPIPEPVTVALPLYPRAAAAKSLHGLPWAYANACVGQLGLILRRDIIWSKPNGLPESVTDRCRSSHEYVFHLVKQPRYFSAVDEIRESYEGKPQRRGGTDHQPGEYRGQNKQTLAKQWDVPQAGVNPLGKLPGSVWSIREDSVIPPDALIAAAAVLARALRVPGQDVTPGVQDAEYALAKMVLETAATAAGRNRKDKDSTGEVWQIPSQPLTVPPALGVDHFAAFPMELPRRIILGWSPAGICVRCGQGRRPVTERGTPRRHNNGRHAIRPPAPGDTNNGTGATTLSVIPDYRITGYACACTRPPRAQMGETYAAEFGHEAHACPAGECDGSGTVQVTGCTCGAGPTGYYGMHERGCGLEPCSAGCAYRTPLPPTRPAIIVDPFGGTGTTALVARALGRHAVTVDMSADYCRLAAWRLNDPGERARAAEVPKPPPVHEDQATLFEVTA